MGWLCSLCALFGWHIVETISLSFCRLRGLRRFRPLPSSRRNMCSSRNRISSDYSLRQVGCNLSHFHRIRGRAIGPERRPRRPGCDSRCPLFGGASRSFSSNCDNSGADIEDGSEVTLWWSSKDASLLVETRALEGDVDWAASTGASRQAPCFARSLYRPTHRRIGVTKSFLHVNTTFQEFQPAAAHRDPPNLRLLDISARRYGMNRIPYASFPC